MSVVVISFHCHQKLVMGVMEYPPLDSLLFRARLANRMWNTFALDQARLLLAACLSKVNRGIHAKLRLLYRGHILGETLMLNGGLSIHDNQWAISMDFKPFGWRDYYYRDGFPVVKDVKHPVVKRIELFLAQRDSMELMGDLEGTE